MPAGAACAPRPACTPRPGCSARGVATARAVHSDVGGQVGSRMRGVGRSRGCLRKRSTDHSQPSRLSSSRASESSCPTAWITSCPRQPDSSKCVRHPSVAATCAERQDDATRQLRPGIGAAEHDRDEVFVHRLQVVVEIRDEVVGVLKPEPDAHVAQAATREFRHHVDKGARLARPTAVVGENDAHAVTPSQSRQSCKVVGRAVDLRPMRLGCPRRGGAGLAETDLRP